jgi:hypothetical protein
MQRFFNIDFVRLLDGTCGKYTWCFAVYHTSGFRHLEKPVIFRSSIGGKLENPQLDGLVSSIGTGVPINSSNDRSQPGSDKSVLPEPPCG